MPDNILHNKLYKCFVCEKAFQLHDIKYHSEVNLPVCKCCKNTTQEAVKIKEMLDELADGFVCGCI